MGEGGGEQDSGLGRMVLMSCWGDNRGRSGMESGKEGVGEGFWIFFSD